MWSCRVELALYCSLLLVTAIARTGSTLLQLQDLNLNWPEDGERDVAFPVRIDPEHGRLRRGLLPNVGAGRRRREASGKERLVYRFSGFGVDYELQLEPNEALLSPAAYMQTVEMGSDGNENVVSEDIVDEGCHLAGWALADAGANASQYRGQAAVSVCDGNMTGVLKMLHYEMLIRVDTGGQNHKDLGQAHVLHRRARGTKATGEEQECHVTHADDVHHREAKLHEHKRSAGSIPSAEGSTLYVETLVAVDKYVINKHHTTNSELLNYVLTLINIANMLWANSATGFDVRFVVLRVMLLATTPQHLTLSNNSLVLMRSFCAWQYLINQNETSWRHHDYAILLTGNELCATSDVGCGELGRAYVKAMCRPEYACQVAYDSGVRAGFVVAHETGHSFGMYHDGDRNSCGDTREIMSSQVSGQADLYHWSYCSKEYIQEYLKNGYNYDCLLDIPSQRLDYPDKWMGKRYNLDDQCSLQTGKKSKLCHYSWAQTKICQVLWCQDKNMCTTVYIPAADGSTCDTNKVCVRGQCVPENEKDFYSRHDAPVHGGWGDWSVFSQCSRSCGGGMQYQEQHCNSPRPRNGGKECKGAGYNLELCNTLPCPDDTKDERKSICLRKRDRNGNQLQPYYHRKRPCAVYCYDAASSRKRRQRNVLANGFKCHPNTESNDRCFKGRCEKFGCDDQWMSNTEKDKCGVCGGTNQSCLVQRETFNSPVTVSGYTEVCRIPRNARDVFVKGSTILDVYLAVKLQHPNIFVLNGNEDSGAAWQNIKAAGSVIDYSRSAYTHETIKIRDPLDQSITIMVFSPSETKVKPVITCQYSIATSGWSRRPALFMYLWKRRVSQCTRTCRGGTKEVSYYCHVPVWNIEVDYDFCGAPSPPKRQIVQCNTDVLCQKSGNTSPLPAPSYQWQLNEWGGCSVTCGTGLRKRTPHCYDDTANEYVELNRCQEPVPPITQSCTVTRCPPKPVHGGWSDWLAKGVCSRTCGTGVQLETRTCSNPSPKNGGKDCSGDSKRYRCCNTQACWDTHGNSTDELTAQCRNRYPNSVAQYARTDLLSCHINCQLENGLVRTISAEDGTRCEMRSANRCLNGACWVRFVNILKLVGCDCVFGSAKGWSSSCGLCTTDSASCLTVVTKYRMRHRMSGYYHVLDVPKGAYQLHLRMVRRSKFESSMLLRSFAGIKISSSDFSGKVSDYRFLYGGEVSYRYIAASQEESLFFYGPTEDAMEIFLRLAEYDPSNESPRVDVTYKISSALKYRVDMMTQLHGWTLVNTGCSAECGTGDGFEKWEVQCALKETGEHVDYFMCSRANYKPKSVEGSPCKASGNCPGMEWYATEWGPCSVSCDSGEQTRHVRCVSTATASSVRDELCDASVKPSIARECLNSDCVRIVVNTLPPSTPVHVTESSYAWLTKPWRSCSVSCGQGIQARGMRCIHRATKRVKSRSRCESIPRPLLRKVCDAGPCIRPTTPVPTTILPTTSVPPTTLIPNTAGPVRYVWTPRPWGSCSVTCGTGYQKRGMRCIDKSTGRAKSKSLCYSTSLIPVTMKQCILKACPPNPDAKKCTREPSYCIAIRDHNLCGAPNFMGKCCKSC